MIRSILVLGDRYFLFAKLHPFMHILKCLFCVSTVQTTFLLSRMEPISHHLLNSLTTHVSIVVQSLENITETYVNTTRTSSLDMFQ